MGVFYPLTSQPHLRSVKILTGYGDGDDDEEINVQEPIISAKTQADERYMTHWKSPRLEAKEYRSVTVVN